jgi:hypothetical protein
MKKVVKTLFLAIAASIALSQPAYSLEWPPNEVKITCPRIIRATLPDGTFAYYGCGTRENYARQELAANNPVETGQKELGAKIKNLQLIGIQTPEIISFLVATLKSRLFSADISWDETNLLFSEALTMIEREEFYPEDKWGDFGTDFNIRYALEKLSGLGWYHTKRYGKVVVESLERLTSRYPKNEFLSDQLERSIKGLIFQDKNVWEKNHAGLLTPMERREYAEKLIDFYTRNPERYILIGEDDIRELQIIAPEFLPHLKILKALREK